MSREEEAVGAGRRDGAGADGLQRRRNSHGNAGRSGRGNPAAIERAWAVYQQMKPRASIGDSAGKKNLISAYLLEWSIGASRGRSSAMDLVASCT